MSPSLLTIKSNILCFRSGLWSREYPLVMTIGFSLMILISFSSGSNLLLYSPCKWNEVESKCEYLSDISYFLATDNPIVKKSLVNPYL